MFLYVFTLISSLQAIVLITLKLNTMHSNTIERQLYYGRKLHEYRHIVASIMHWRICVDICKFTLKVESSILVMQWQWMRLIKITYLLLSLPASCHSSIAYPQSHSHLQLYLRDYDRVWTHCINNVHRYLTQFNSTWKKKCINAQKKSFAV